MFSRRIALAMLGAVLILTAGVMPVSAARPTRPAPAVERPTTSGERPLTPAEQAASDRKVAAAMAYLASPAAMTFGRVTLDCAAPGGAPPDAATSGSDDLGASAIPRRTPTATSPPTSWESRHGTRPAGTTAGRRSAR